MSTLAPGGRISLDVVEEEIHRLGASWANPQENDRLGELLGSDRLSEIDLFDRAQLNQVLEVCAKSRTLSEAGRTLYGASRSRKTTANDADRLRKYLVRFDLDWAAIQTR
jgi:transcriptional regulatory protein RtcR